MTQTELKTTTKEQTEISVDTEEITLTECPVCEQQVTDEELVPVTIGSGEMQTATCEFCVSSLYDFEPEEDVYDTAAMVGEAADSVADKLFFPLLRLAIPAAIVFFVFGTVLSEMQYAVSQVPEDEVAQIGAPAFTLAEIAPVFLIMFLAAMIINALTIMPRMR